MGTNLSTFRSQTIQPKQSRFLGYDPWLLVVVISMIVFGLVMVYSASWNESWKSGTPNLYFIRQVRNLLFGLIALAIASRIPLRWLRTLALPGMVVAMIALFAVLVFGEDDGPRRAFFNGSIQPSELAKLVMIIYLAVWMESKEDRLRDWNYGLIPLVIMIGLVGGLILLQPDLSAAITIGIVSLVLFYLAGATWTQTGTIALGSAGIGLLLVRVSNTGQKRWAEYINGFDDVEKASYHVKESLHAFFSGGLFGRGLGASHVKFGIIPYPHTDSIFAIVGEELGLIGALLVLFLFGFFIWRGFRIAMKQPDRLGSLLASGLTFWIGLEAVVNMSVLLGLLPFAGNALPFFSYGGSSLVTSLTAIGLLLNISRWKLVETRAKEHVATISFGRGHRGRSVSRLGRRRRTPKKR